MKTQLIKGLMHFKLYIPKLCRAMTKSKAKKTRAKNIFKKSYAGSYQTVVNYSLLYIYIYIYIILITIIGLHE